MVQVTKQLILKSSVYVKHEPNKAKGKYICHKQSVFAWSDMTLTVDLPTPFMVIAHPMTIDSLGGK